MGIDKTNDLIRRRAHSSRTIIDPTGSPLISDNSEIYYAYNVYVEQVSGQWLMSRARVNYHEAGLSVGGRRGEGPVIGKLISLTVRQLVELPAPRL